MKNNLCNESFIHESSFLGVKEYKDSLKDLVHSDGHNKVS